MTYSPNFDVDFSRGKIGEDLVEQLPEMIRDGKVEVKTDSLAIKTGNFYVETWQRNIYNMEWRMSGINITTADYWAFVVEQTGAMFLVSTESLKKLLDTNRDVYREGEQRIVTTQTNGSRGRLVPVLDIASQMLGKK
jgi:hypothetical protein